VRTSLIALGLALAACGRSERPTAAAGTTAAHARRGHDLLVLRTPRTGGTVRVFAYPQLDSLVWSSDKKAPALERILGFDDAAGIVLAEAPPGTAVRIDLRLGTITPDEAPRLRAIATADGAAAFGVAPNGGIVRVTTSGAWGFKPPSPVRDVLPQPDGQLLLLADRPGGAILWSVRPPDSTITDSAALPAVARAIRTPVGDRVYFTAGRQLLARRVRTLDSLPSVTLPRQASGVATTPSGDRVYVGFDSLPQLIVLDRYTGKIAATIELPAPAVALRMDPFGRLVIVRTTGDSAFIVAVGTDRLVGTVRGAWRPDLPAIAPNGWVAVASANDVVFLSGDSLRVQRTVAGGAKDLWSFFAWNGFRPRAAELDEPVTFPEDTIVPRDSLAPFAVDSTRTAADSAAKLALPPGAPAPVRDTAPRGPQFTVQFAALKSDSAARVAIRSIHVAGAEPRVVPNAHDGVITFRVVIGPFPTRAEAERVARTAGLSYWIYEGAP
jgi:cell division septation protein DedD